MSRLRMELALLLRPGLAGVALVLLALLAGGAVVNGLGVIDQQRVQLVRAQAAHDAELAGLKPGEAGSAAYATPHLALNPAAPLAFAALGNLDLQPSALRIRLLGLHAQLYESESINPELAMAGRFDFAFVLVYLAPLLMIALVHDLSAGEREAGRLRLLASLPGATPALWRWRLGLRFALVLAACLLPLIAGALYAGAAGGALLVLCAAAACYLGFWFGVGAWFAALARSAAEGAAALLACLVLLTMLLPALANAVIGQLLPVARGVELALAQRQAVHRAWDLPKQETMERFFQSHPEWRDTEPVGTRFHWKWYFAMQQVGDEAVAGQLAAYRASLAARDRWSERAGWLLAAVDMQLLMQRLAQTDLQAQLAFYDRVAAFHARLRRAYYPGIFNAQPLGPDEAGMARFDPHAADPALPPWPLFNLALLAVLALALGARQLGRGRG